MSHRFIIASLLALLSIVTACDSVEPPDAVLAPPAQLRAVSGDSALALAWEHSTDREHAEFSGYHVMVSDTRTGATIDMDVGTDSSARIDKLENGALYMVFVHSRTRRGKLSPGYAAIEWSPAPRRTLDMNGWRIRLHTSMSKRYPCAVDIWNGDGMVEALHIDSEGFRARASFYLHATSPTSNLIVRSPDLAFAPGPATYFADPQLPGTVLEANHLDELLAAGPPDSAAYTARHIVVPNGSYTHGRVYFGKLSRPEGDMYFRLHILRAANGRLQRGSGEDRYIEIEVSIQSQPGNRYAKQR